MKIIQPLLGQNIAIDISGGELKKGKLLDIGADLIVIFDGNDYVYIPFTHIQQFYINKDDYDDFYDEGLNPFEDITLSMRSILNIAKGIFTEIKVVGKQSIHGYITNVQSDYLVFYSPVFKTMFIPIHHLKWLIPYQNSQTPYSLDNNKLPVNPSSISIARSFEVQLQKLTGRIVVFDLGTDERRIGQLRKIESNLIELITAKEEVVLINLNHIKSVHFE